MSATTPVNSSAMQRILLLGIAICLVLSVAGIIFASRVFTVGFTIGCSIVLFFPFVIAVQVLCEPSIVKGNKLVIACILFIFVCALGLCICAANVHAHYIWFAVLTHHVHSDPAFDNVELSVERFSSKDALHAFGVVASQSDYDRLKALSIQYGFPWIMDKIRVVRSSKSASSQ